MLDDVFSGLDAKSEEHIFSRLLGKSGLLRKMGTTVILVTHAAHRLSFANYIYVIGAEGRIVEQGSFQDLVRGNGYVASLTTRHMKEDVKPEKGPIVTKAPADDVARQNAAADLNRPVGSWAVYNYYFRSAGRRTVLSWLCLMASYSVSLRFPGNSSPALWSSHDLSDQFRHMDQILDLRSFSTWQLC